MLSLIILTFSLEKYKKCLWNKNNKHDESTANLVRYLVKRQKRKYETTYYINSIYTYYVIHILKVNIKFEPK